MSSGLTNAITSRLAPPQQDITLDGLAPRSLPLSAHAWAAALDSQPHPLTALVHPRFFESLGVCPFDLIEIICSNPTQVCLPSSLSGIVPRIILRALPSIDVLSTDLLVHPWVVKLIQTFTQMPSHIVPTVLVRKVAQARPEESCVPSLPVYYPLSDAYFHPFPPNPTASLQSQSMLIMIASRQLRCLVPLTQSSPSSRSSEQGPNPLLQPPWVHNGMILPLSLQGSIQLFLSVHGDTYPRGVFPALRTTTADEARSCTMTPSTPSSMTSMPSLLSQETIAWLQRLLIESRPIPLHRPTISQLRNHCSSPSITPLPSVAPIMSGLESPNFLAVLHGDVDEDLESELLSTLQTPTHSNTIHPSSPTGPTQNSTPFRSPIVDPSVLHVNTIPVALSKVLQGLPSFISSTSSPSSSLGIGVRDRLRSIIYGVRQSITHHLSSLVSKRRRDGKPLPQSPTSFVVCILFTELDAFLTERSVHPALLKGGDDDGDDEDEGSSTLEGPGHGPSNGRKGLKVHNQDGALLTQIIDDLSTYNHTLASEGMEVHIPALSSQTIHVPVAILPILCIKDIQLLPTSLSSSTSLTTPFFIPSSTTSPLHRVCLVRSLSVATPSLYSRYHLILHHLIHHLNTRRSSSSPTYLPNILLLAHDVPLTLLASAHSAGLLARSSLFNIPSSLVQQFITDKPKDLIDNVSRLCAAFAVATTSMPRAGIKAHIQFAIDLVDLTDNTPFNSRLSATPTTTMPRPMPMTMARAMAKTEPIVPVGSCNHSLDQRPLIGTKPLEKTLCWAHFQLAVTLIRQKATASQSPRHAGMPTLSGSAALLASSDDMSTDTSSMETNNALLRAQLANVLTINEQTISRPIETGSTASTFSPSSTSLNAPTHLPPIDPFPGIFGYTQLKQRLLNIVRLWLNPSLCARLGVRPPGGMILHGPSGCGKSLFARQLCMQSGLNHIKLGCGDILKRYLGESEKVIRNAFMQARNNTPCILYIDDIDTIAPNRGMVLAHSSAFPSSVESQGEENEEVGKNAHEGGRDEQKSMGRNTGDSGTGVETRILSTLLNELDGISSRKGVYLVATSRSLSDVDAALLRPGRLDEHIMLCEPNEDDRYMMLQGWLGHVDTKCSVNPTMAPEGTTQKLNLTIPRHKEARKRKGQMLLQVKRDDLLISEHMAQNPSLLDEAISKETLLRAISKVLQGYSSAAIQRVANEAVAKAMRRTYKELVKMATLEQDSKVSCRSHGDLSSSSVGSVCLQLSDFSKALAEATSISLRDMSQK